MHLLMRTLFSAYMAGGKQRKSYAIILEDVDRDLTFELPRIVKPWKQWFNLVWSGTKAEAKQADIAGPIDVVLLALADPKTYAGGIPQRGGPDGKIITAAYPVRDSWESDLIREMAHHDYELGGVNEWDGSPTKYPWPVLQRLSATHAKRSFPMWAYRHARDCKPLEVLDIGCGPISLLRWGVECGWLNVVGLDPLLDIYAVLLARHGHERAAGMDLSRSVNGTAERLREHFKPASFDSVHTVNSLDHVQDIVKVIDNIGWVLKPGGTLVAAVATREGSRQNWDQFHKTDIFTEDGAMFYNLKDMKKRPLFPASSGLKLVKIGVNTDRVTSFMATKA